MKAKVEVCDVGWEASGFVETILEYSVMNLDHQAQSTDFGITSFLKVKTTFLEARLNPKANLLISVDQTATHIKAVLLRLRINALFYTRKGNRKHNKWKILRGKTSNWMPTTMNLPQKQVFAWCLQMFLLPLFGQNNFCLCPQREEDEFLCGEASVMLCVVSGCPEGFIYRLLSPMWSQVWNQNFSADSQ